jgi:glycosyltransferase involved in cell wall biosynthesis
MKVLFFCNLVPDKLGAFEHWLVRQGDVLREAGDLLVLALAAEPFPPLAERLRAVGVTWHVVEGWTDRHGGEHAWRFCLPAWRILRRESPDVTVIHFGNELPSMVVRLCAAGMGIRTVWVWQQHQQIGPPHAMTRHISRIRLLSWFFDHVTVVYDGGAESMRARGLSVRKVGVIYNCIPDHASERPGGWLKQELGIPERAVLMVTIGWLIPRKRIDFIVSALAQCGDPHAHLLVVGEGPLRSELEGHAGRSGVGDRVHFLGVRNDVREILHECDMLVHAARAETCTYVISEAMASRLPVVVTEAGAAREQIVEGETGYVLAQDDVSGLAARLRELLEDRHLRERLGAAGRQRWEARYDLEQAVLQYHELYRRLVAKKR